MDTFVQEPQGVAFYSIDTGETHYCKLEPTIAAYINSSDMGINASRGQDFGWRLDKSWVQRVREFRRDRLSMQILTAANQGQKPTTVQILYHLYGEDLRAYAEELEEHEHPYEEQYQQDIADGARRRPTATAAPVAEDAGEDDIADLIDEEIDTDAGAEAATSDGEGASEQVEEVKDGNGGSKPTKPATAKQK